MLWLTTFPLPLIDIGMPVSFQNAVTSFRVHPFMSGIVSVDASLSRMMRSLAVTVSCACGY